MISDKTVNIKITQQILNNLLDIKNFYKKGDYVDVLINDLKQNSSIKVNVLCDKCEKKNYITYNSYNLQIKKNTFYYCKKCAVELRKKTCIKKYGVDSYSKTEEFKNKTKELFLNNYGVDNPMKSLHIQEKVKRTNLEKYGVDSYSKTKEHKNHISKITKFKKSDFKKIRKSNIDKKIYNKYFEKINKYEYDLIEYSNGHFKLYHKICHSKIDIKYQLFLDRLNTDSLCTICNPLYKIYSSDEENKIKQFLDENNIEYIEQTKKIIPPYELDIYIPSEKLAIEFNGLYWHSEKFKNKNYHLEKTLKCSCIDIQLLHIWEDEWVYKKDIIKSIILNKLNIIENKIYARQCEIRVINDSKLVREFLDTNHIQGYSQSSIKLGLYYKNELVSLMTFGYRHTNSKKEFELIRFCNRINLNVIGSASKLFNYFKQNYHFTELISYSDFRLFDGKLYQTLGFTKQHLSKPDYFWCKNLERKHRFNFNKQKLIKEGYDSSKTEVEIMHERGYYRIFGCGQYKWEFKN